MRSVLALIVVAALDFWMPSAFAGSRSWQGDFPGYKAIPLNDADDAAIRRAVLECWLSLNTKDHLTRRTSNAPELEFNNCVGARHIPLIFLLK